VHELLALSDDAYAALWEYAFSIDLVQTIRGDHRPVDDSITWMLADPRRMKRVTRDSLWVRILDVERALAGRRYASEGGIVLSVEDPFCGWVGGTYALEGGPDGAGCRLSPETPDIELSAADLGAVYMGATSFRTLACAGRVHGSDDALRRADALFGWHPAPWCPEVF
jgi:predicted acetyltransferase